jgi:hypothetical protein
MNTTRIRSPSVLARLHHENVVETFDIYCELH